jgi:hypothetical protein
LVLLCFREYEAQLAAEAKARAAAKEAERLKKLADFEVISHSDVESGKVLNTFLLSFYLLSIFLSSYIILFSLVLLILLTNVLCGITSI